MTKHPKVRRTCLFPMAAMALLVTGACEQAANANAELDGYWWSGDYGVLLDISGEDVQWIEQTPVSCLPIRTRSVENLRARMATPPDLANGIIAVGHKAMLSTKNFVRLDEGGFDELCPDGLTERSDDLILNFEVLWHTFDQHYAFFEERDVDWDAVYAENRPKITEDMESEDLGGVLVGILNRLKDAHVYLDADGDHWVSVETRLDKRLRTECRQLLGDDCNAYNYAENQDDAFEEILERVYLRNETESSLNGLAQWGRIDADTGYFKIDAMAGFASGYSASTDLEQIDSALDEMLDDIGDLPSMIIDARFNGGGHDTVSVAIANRFADQRRVFGTKRAFAGGDEAEVTDMVIAPYEGRRFDGDVALLISSETASAAEIFAMAMRALPHVTLIGTPTMGILSDEHYRMLPNGWSLSLSNEIYLTHDDALFEAVGVPPDVEASVLLPDDLKRRVDRGIDTAIAVLSGKDETGSKSH